MKELLYLVTCVITSIQPTTCPDTATINEFGFEQQSIISCSVAHYKTVHTHHEKLFHAKDSALAFIERAKKHNNKNTDDILSMSPDSYTIDSIKLNELTTIGQ